MTDVPAEQTTFNFQAEIQQLLHILVHALYTERDIFLRELISNASDALNRAQFESLTNRDMRDQDAELAIRITVDDDARTVTISDSGIGMTRDDLINNLGVIARSGARAFIDALKDAKDAETAKSVIGQFVEPQGRRTGVGVGGRGRHQLHHRSGGARPARHGRDRHAQGRRRRLPADVEAQGRHPHLLRHDQLPGVRRRGRRADQSAHRHLAAGPERDRGVEVRRVLPVDDLRL
ncbi:MAG: hypothetical protein IPM16_19905 [Chloroflexi bacterium]|nr:hypothetical protein [Chloroflexota bacterium]